MMGSSFLASEASTQEFGDSDLGASPPALLIIANDDQRARAAEDAAALAAAQVIGRSNFEQVERTLANLGSVDVLLLEAGGAEPDVLDRLLRLAQAAVVEKNAGLVVCFEEAQIDQVAAQLAGLDAQLLCQPGTAERLAALTVARPRQVPKFAGATENEGDRLRRLSEEVARIAEALTRLTTAAGSGARERWGHAPASLDQFHLEPGPIPADGEEAPLQASAIRAVIRARRLRGQYFDAQLFADPAWDMLLDLTAARLEETSVSVSSLCIAAAVPPTTALRWITTMIEAGLFERQDDPHDRRRAYVALTDQAFEGMRNYTAALRRMGLHVF